MFLAVGVYSRFSRAPFGQKANAHPVPSCLYGFLHYCSRQKSKITLSCAPLRASLAQATRKRLLQWFAYALWMASPSDRAVDCDFSKKSAQIGKKSRRCAGPGDRASILCCLYNQKPPISSQGIQRQEISGLFSFHCFVISLHMRRRFALLTTICVSQGPCAVKIRRPSAMNAGISDSGASRKRLR